MAKQDENLLPAVFETEKKKKNARPGWKTLTIGGFTGIVLGFGSSMASEIVDVVDKGGDAFRGLLGDDQDADSALINKKLAQASLSDDSSETWPETQDEKVEDPIMAAVGESVVNDSSVVADSTVNVVANATDATMSKDSVSVKDSASVQSVVPKTEEVLEDIHQTETLEKRVEKEPIPQVVDAETPQTAVEEKTFAEAFAEARSALGPGATFTYKGNLCSTYTKEEWEKFSEQERNEFVDKAVAGKVTSHQEASPEENDLAANNLKSEKVESIDEKTKETKSEDDKLSEVKPEEAKAETIKPEAAEEEPDVEEAELIAEAPAAGGSESVLHSPLSLEVPDIPPVDDDVRIISQQRMEMEDGTPVDVAHIQKNGEDVAIIDIDLDGEYDIVIADLNDNGIPEEGEIIDMHTSQVISIGSTFPDDVSTLDNLSDGSDAISDVNTEIF